MSFEQEIIDAALTLHDLGFNVVPIGNMKRPALTTWKEWQTQRQTREWVQEMMELPNLHGLAVVCGTPWNGLTIIDYDDPAGYRQFCAQNSSLSKMLPTVETARGYHLWVRNDGYRSTKFQYGDIKGIGGYGVAPPSRHSIGKKYKWKIKFKELPQVDISSLIDVSNRPVTESTECTEAISSVVSVLSVTPSVDEAIRATTPQVEGQRHRLIFDFARRLKGIPECSIAHPTALEPAVREWHKRALPNIGTKRWDDTWSEFLTAWPNVRTPYGSGTVNQAMDRIRSSGQLAPARYESEPARLLYLLCRELDRINRPNPFFLSCSVASEVLGIDKMTANRYLRRMVLEQTLKIVEDHTPSRATRYRFMEAPA